MINKFIKIFIFGLIGLVILGLTAMLFMMNYGGNYGCFSFVDSLFYPLRGYESCGAFGMWLGAIIGFIIGSLIGIKIKFR